MSAFCLPLALIAAAAVIFVAPKAAGSGLAEVKAMPNGSHIAGLLTFTAAFVKIFGVIFTITAGLALGREGPMVHIGADISIFIVHDSLLENHLRSSCRCTSCFCVPR
jgi:chloride channel 7